ALLTDTTIHVADQLADERKAQTLAVLLAGDERLKNMLAQSWVYARSVVADLHLDRQFDRPPQAHDVACKSADEACADDDLRVSDVTASIPRVDDQVDQHLDQRAFVGEHRRERRIELFPQRHWSGARSGKDLDRAPDRSVLVDGFDLLRVRPARPVHANGELS